jgi:DNA helicase-2/ATP-dependent DNA helicase PcrA
MENLYKYVGPPGCGKTETLKGSVEKNAALFGRQQIMACSLTTTAARVLEGRVNLPKENVGTLHSVCYRALGCPELTVKQKYMKEFNEKYPHFELSLAAANVDDLRERAVATEGDAYRNEMEIFRARRLPFELWSPDAQSFHKAWSAWKADCGLMDFTDLLETCLDDFETAPGDPAVIIGDEAQDWSRLALDLLLQWGRKCRKLILAADANQAIFSWAGADARIFLSLPVKPENRFVLAQSYRLPRVVHERAQTWIRQATVREDAEFCPRKDATGNVVEGFFEETDESLREGLEDLMQRAVEMSETKTVMVLAATSYHVSKYVRVLRDIGAPFHNPNRIKESYWNPLAKQKDGPADRVRAFLKGAKGVTWTRRDVSLWLETVKAEGRLRRGGKKVLEAWKDQNEPLTIDDLRDLCTPAFYGQLFELTCLTNKKDVDGALQSWLNISLPEYADKLEYPARVIKSHGKSALFERPKITVGTIHSVKGDEADVVILFPDLSPAAHRQWEGEPDERDEIIRTFYVGLTRAREGVILCSPSSPRHVDGI